MIGGNESETNITIGQEDVNIDDTVKDEKLDENIADMVNAESDEEILVEDSIITGECWNPIGEKFTIELSGLR